MHVILFDLDDTLVRSMEMDGHYFGDAIEAELHGEICRNWQQYEHVSDSGILHACALDHWGRAVRPDEEKRIKKRFFTSMAQALKNDPKVVEVMSGAAALLDYIAENRDMVFALATDGWRTSACMKLKHAGLWREDLILKTSDDAMARTAIMQLALTHVSENTVASSVTYVGDALWDIEATSRLGWNFIGIGNKVKHSPKWVPDFLDIERFLSLVTE